MVLFRLDAVREFATDARIKQMYFLGDGAVLEPHSHVILTSAGRFLAPSQGTQLCLADQNGVRPWSQVGASFYSQFRQYLDIYPGEEVDCLGFGRKAPLPPVLLHLEIKNGTGHARAIFHRPPSQAGYELLKAVGVKYLGGEPRGESWVAFFRNRVQDHIDAAALAGFTRTAHCNEFFLRHGEIGPDLEAGLVQSLRNRIWSGRRRALTAAVNLAQNACRTSLAMTCHPPAPAAPFPYGDLVPLGFLLRALQHVRDDTAAEAGAVLRNKLLAARRGELWAFHTGRLVTATDSALIQQAFSDTNGINALERFSDGQGGYYPQLWAETREPDRMIITDANRHWCQPDFPTTCLVRGLRIATALPTLTPSDYLERRFESRAGLYFANPYLVDWALAQAIAGDPAEADMRSRLIGEVLASMNEDCSFGTWDQAVSTALAILTLASLGCRGRLLSLCQLRLLGWMDSEGLCPESTPFYSTFRCGDGGGNLDCDGARFELSFYRDTHRIIGTALALLALEQTSSPETNDMPRPNGQAAHARYGCATQDEYVARFALRPYVGGTRTAVHVSR